MGPKNRAKKLTLYPIWPLSSVVQINENIALVDFYNTWYAAARKCIWFSFSALLQLWEGPHFSRWSQLPRWEEPTRRPQLLRRIHDGSVLQAVRRGQELWRQIRQEGRVEVSACVLNYRDRLKGGPLAYYLGPLVAWGHPWGQSEPGGGIHAP